MKRITSILLLLVAFSAAAQNSTPLDTAVWKCNYDQLLAQSKETGKPILMVFSGSDWCKPCIKLREQILVKPEFSEWSTNKVYCLSLDFPAQKKNALNDEQRLHNERLAEKFNTSGVFPLLIIVDSNETILASLGFKDVSVQEYIEDLEKQLNNH
ncbi:MAG: thioredoxin family protein [Bacteroidetes bacterium HGW-Bacteroidetes-6]|jgi:thioredoxin-related protein|nr:MAG: thioredoxin family protein [Bacteroidetes bacterium HGW-Bacteroidetes-6]